MRTVAKRRMSEPRLHGKEVVLEEQDHAHGWPHGQSGEERGGDGFLGQGGGLFGGKILSRTPKRRTPIPITGDLKSE